MTWQCVSNGDLTLTPIAMEHPNTPAEIIVQQLYFSKGNLLDRQDVAAMDQPRIIHSGQRALQHVIIKGILFELRGECHG